MELLAKLGINWGLLIAQVVNFSIVVGALTFLIYRPLLNVLDQRSERIKKAMEDAKKIESQKREIEEFRLEQLKKIDIEVGAFLERAKKEAEHSKQQIIASAQQEANRILQKGKEQLEDERTRVFADVRSSMADMIVRLSEKIMGREFTPADQKRLLTDITKDLPATVR